jgi:uncharacterized repeat protein (TIGR01451 family)
MAVFSSMLRVAIALGLTCGGVAQAACLVKADASGGNDGSSWANAYTNLQSALGDAACGEIWVARGTYVPGAVRASSFAIAPGRIVYGGFAGSETAPTQADPVANETILSGDIGIPGDAADNTYHVVRLDGTTAAGTITATTVLDGFTIRDGNANGGFPDQLGGGLYCNGNVSSRNCSPTLSRLRFLSNKAFYGGAAGLRADGAGNASPTLRDVVFDGNSAADQGGALYIWAEFNGVASPSIERVTFSANQADQGGAIYNESGNQGGTAKATIVNSTFHGNDASLGTGVGNGGAIYNHGIGGNAAMTLTNVTFSGNSANGANHFGGAMVNEGAGAKPVITHAIFWADQASANPEFHNTVGAQPTISHSIVAGSGGSGAGWAAAFGVDGGGNLDADPALGALAANGGYTRTLLPASASAAIDAGDDAVCPSTDQRGAPRPQSAHCDIGAVEVVPPHRCYVNHAATGANDGFAWASAHVDLQSALQDALCNEVWVAKGVYKPTTSTTDRTATFSIPPGLKVYGGFAGTETSAAQADPAANRTVLSGDIDGNDTTDADGVVLDANQIAGNNALKIVLVDGTTAAGPVGADTVLDGFAITGGAGGPVPGLLDTQGGGLYCNGRGLGHVCAPVLSRLWFSGNHAQWAGAVFADGDLQGSAPVLIRDSLFSGNHADNAGGAAIFSTSNATIVRSTFAGNVAGWGSAIQANRGAQPLIAQSTFSGNVADNASYASTVVGSSNAQIAFNEIIWHGNTGPDMLIVNGAAATVARSLLQGQGACPSGATCTDLVVGDPQLGPLQYNGGATMTLLPGAGSVAIDAGDLATCGTAPYDVDQRGVARPQGPACDIGSVEVRQVQLVVGVSGPGSATADDAAGVAPVSGAIAACTEEDGDCVAGYSSEAAPTVVLDLTPALHAHLVSVTDVCGANGDPSGTLSGTTYTIAPLSQDCAVVAVFETDTHAVGGTLTGLVGGGLQLQINGGESVTVASGATTFQFPTALAWDTHYEVAVSAQPTQPWQTCTVANGSGDVGDGAVDTIAVSCTTNAYTVGGSVDGLAGSGLVLRLNGSQSLSPTIDGPFTFTTSLASGSAYAVTVEQSPPGQACTLERASGTMAGADVADVAVHCAVLPAHLTLAFDGGGDFARYGQVVDYTFTLSNDGFSEATQVPVDLTLSSAFDAQYTQWQCFGGNSGAVCSANGNGPLHDVATLPPGRSLTWRVSVPVFADSQEVQATLTLAIGGAQPLNQSSVRTLVLFRDGYDVPYGNGTQVVDPTAQAIFDGAATHAFTLPPPGGERLDAVLVVRGTGGELQVQRTPLDATTSLLRLSYRAGNATARVSPWTAVRNDGTLAIGGIRGAGDRQMLLLEGGDTPLTLVQDSAE